MKKKIFKIIDLLEDVDKNYEELTKEQSTVDKAISDILHFIQNEPLHNTKDFKVIKELKRLRQTRS